MTASKLYSDPPTEPMPERRMDYGVLAAQVKTLREVNEARDKKLDQWCAEQGAKIDGLATDVRTLTENVRPLVEMHQAVQHAGTVTVRAAKAIDAGVRWAGERVGPLAKVAVGFYFVYMVCRYGFDPAMAFLKKTAE